MTRYRKKLKTTKPKLFVNKISHKIKNRFLKNGVLICFKMQKQHNIIL